MPAAPSQTEILVLGAGLQGAGIALELARRGIAATLLDQDEAPLNRASRRNEGKIHLGLIYANDAGGTTALTQLEGALTFRRIVSRWLGGRDAWMVRSTPFDYLVARDSVLPAAALSAHYDALGRHCRERLAEDPSLDYLGERPAELARPASSGEVAARYGPDRVDGAFRTAERAIDPDVLADALRGAIIRAEPLTFLPSRRVRTIERTRGGFAVSGDGPMGPWTLHAAQVVNATWERRPALDRQLGIDPPAGLLHRLKYRVIARLPESLHGAPSVTIVLGRYGDVVVRPDGTAYLSWYPAGLRGWSTEVEPPRAWDAGCRGESEPEAARAVGAAILAALDDWYPGIGAASAQQVDAGAIVAIGRSDVDDPGSGLHDRSRIGVTSAGGYHSVDPGKLTTAPRFALEAADRIEALRGGCT